MIIGVDFDNTIVCYDEVIHAAALRQGLIPASIPVTKGAVRDYLRTQGKEDLWTELQGYVYGIGIREAPPFPGVKEFFSHCLKQGISIWIISHKTTHPFRGPEYDLHRAAHEWLDLQGFYDPIGLPRGQVRFEVTLQEKLERIVKTRCTHFIDDLPEFLSEPEFPSGVERILFNPGKDPQDTLPCRKASSWGEISAILVC